MNWIDSIKEIRRVADENRLVVFVGSGVSANSNIPTWGELIKQFAKELNYNNCKGCIEDSVSCTDDGCTQKYDFSREEYLRIPEYYFNRFKAKKYNRLIKETLECDKDANSINDAIFKIMPHHIITTNYDHLLERSKEANAHLYSVIAKDEDILSNNNPRYILKMHGDIESPKSIVLKESDYIDYEQTHILFSTFIKSLLIDHTFLFVGYSLNDYNLNLIIGWINYFARSSGARNRPLNFIVQSEPASDFEKSRLKKNNIFVISLKNIPKNLLSKITVPADISDPKGLMLYAYLNCMHNTEVYYDLISLADVLHDRFAVLQGYNKISHEDLINAFPQKGVEVKAQTLCFYNKELYSRIVDILTEKSETSAMTMVTFQKACIDELLCFSETDEARIPVPQLEGDEVELLHLYLDNKYSQLAANLHNFSNPLIKAYYYTLLKINTADVSDLMDYFKQSITSGDYIAIVIYKMNCRLLKIRHFGKDIAGEREIERVIDSLPPKYKSAVGYIVKLFNSLQENHMRMRELLEKHEDKYSFENSTYYSEHSFENLWKIQAYAYDYYFFIKKNFLMMDNFREPKEYFSYYIRAILCTYSPVSPSNDDSFFGLRNRLDHYSIGEVEIDMLVKYTDPKNLLSWIKTYKVSCFELDDGVDITSKFAAYCESFVFFGKEWADQLYCFIILLSKLKLSVDNQRILATAFIKLIRELSRTSTMRVTKALPAISLFATAIIDQNTDGLARELLAIVISPKITSEMLKENLFDYQMLVSTLSPYSSAKIRNQVCSEIEELVDIRSKCQYIFIYRYLLSKKKYRTFLIENIDEFNSEQLFYLVHEKFISFGERVYMRFSSIIESEITKKKTSGVRSYPDWLDDSIVRLVLLEILGHPVDISKLEKYREYSDYLAFLLSPNDFDYSKVDTKNYMWCNFFHHPEYVSHFYSHRQEILTDELEKVFANGFATVNQQKIVFGHLLDSDQIWNYARN